MRAPAVIVLLGCVGAVPWLAARLREEPDLRPAGVGGPQVVQRAGPLVPGERWAQVKEPSAYGWDPQRLEQARRHAAKVAYSSVMVVDDGAVVAAWGEVARPVNVRSIRKSMLGALIGLGVARGEIKLDETLRQLGIDENERLTSAESSATIRDLLRSSSGVYLPAAYEMNDDRPARGSTAPGERFFYNNWDFNALGTIVRQTRRKDIFAAFDEEIARRLGMEHFDPSACEYRREDVSRHPAYLFKISASDLARFGLLYMRLGRWSDGRAVLDEAWVRESTRPQIKHQLPFPYDSFGYMWWTFDTTPGYSGSFMSTGTGGQLLFVSPADRLVIVALKDVWFAKLGRHVTNQERWDLIKAVKNSRAGS